MPSSPSSAIPSPATRDGSRPTAVVYCEDNFAAIDGKTANGLVRHSAAYTIVSVLDRRHAGHDAGVVLDGVANGIPLHRDLDEAIAHLGDVPDVFIFGIAPTSGMLSHHERRVVLAAMSRGMDIVNGLHEFLSDDAEFVAAGLTHGVRLIDVRRPRDIKDLRTFSGAVLDVPCPRIAVLGTDCAIGKRTTATVLTRALEARGLRTVLIGTGQTGLMQGARHGLALDAVPAQFAAGEMEAAVVAAYEAERPDVIVVEGQGALSHPAYSSSAFILKGSRPHGVVLQHAPGRPRLSDFTRFPTPTPASEIELIETFCDTRVIGLSLNHERLSDDELSAAIAGYETTLGLPVTDALARDPDRLARMALDAFPQLLVDSVATTP